MWSKGNKCRDLKLKESVLSFRLENKVNIIKWTCSVPADDGRLILNDINGREAWGNTLDLQK